MNETIKRPYQRQRYLALQEKLEEIIADRLRRGQRISVRSLAAEAGVERITVYRHAEIMDLIRTYRSG